MSQILLLHDPDVYTFSAADVYRPYLRPDGTLPYAAVIVVNAPAGQSAAWAQVGMMGEAGQAPGGPGQGSRSTETKDRRRSCIKHALNVQNIETEHYSIMYKQVYSLDLISVLPDP